MINFEALSEMCSVVKLSQKIFKPLILRFCSLLEGITLYGFVNILFGWGKSSTRLSWF